jgi:predicted TIM-barrel fold metal-dependent hydrolase
VKLTAPYRLSDKGPDHADVAPMARALYAAAPHRCVWGTDWPHTNTTAHPDTPSLLDLLIGWLPDRAAVERVLVDNPARLYDFPPVGLRPPGAAARR